MRTAPARVAPQIIWMILQRVCGRLCHRPARLSPLTSLQIATRRSASAKPYNRDTADFSGEISSSFLSRASIPSRIHLQELDLSARRSHLTWTWMNRS